MQHNIAIDVKKFRKNNVLCTSSDNEFLSTNCAICINVENIQIQHDMHKVGIHSDKDDINSDD